MRVLCLVFLTLFFVASTSAGHRVEVIEPYNIFLSPIIYISIAFFLGILCISRGRLKVETFFLFLINLVFFSYVFIVGVFGEPRFYYSAMVLVLIPLFYCSLDINTVLSFVRISLVVLLVFFCLKVFDLMFGTSYSLIVDKEYFEASEEFSLRISNSLVFGQRNLAGGVLAAYAMLLACCELINKKRDSVYWGVLFLLVFSTVSTTAILISLVSFCLVRYRFKAMIMVVLILLIAVSLFLNEFLFRSIDSFNQKIGTIYDYFNDIDVMIFLFGRVFDSNLAARWIESAIIDLWYDVGIIGIIILLFNFIVVGLMSAFSNIWFYAAVGYFLLFLFSNSTLNPPVLILYGVTFAIIIKSAAKYNVTSDAPR